MSSPLIRCLWLPILATLPAAAVGDWRLPARFIQHDRTFTLRLTRLEAVFVSSRVEYSLGADRFHMHFPGARVVSPIGLHPEGVVNHFQGSDSRSWSVGARAYGAVAYPEIFPNITLELRAHEGALKSEWHLAIEADPSLISWRYAGASSVTVDTQGGLRIVTPHGELREAPPVAYQPGHAGPRPVDASYVVEPDGTVRFRLGAYDAAQPLVIDPSISFSTSLGGSASDVATGVATDAAGSVYVAGYTDSRDFSTSGGRQLNPAGSVDGFVVKLTASGDLVYATYLGGRGDDRVLAIAVDASGNAVLTGSTSSTNFPTASAFQATYRGARDAFVTRLNSAGTALVFSTYLGGTGLEAGNAVALDAAGDIFVAGETRSTNFPVLTPYQALLGGRGDNFVVKFNSGGVRQYSTYVGGSGDDRALAIAVDAGNQAYLTGCTDSTNYPVLNPAQGASGGGQDAFVTKLGAAGDTVVYSTFLGGNGGSVGYPECGYGIAVDAGGYAHVTGVTTSTNFPIRSAYQASIGIGHYDAFLTKLAPAGSSLVFSTYYGGSGQDTARAIAVDSAGLIYLTGSTASPDFPVANAVQNTSVGALNGFITAFTPVGNQVIFSSYLGGNSLDSSNAIALDSTGGIVVAGQTQSTNFPAVNALQPFVGSDMNAFVAKLGGTGGGALPASTSVTPDTGSGLAQTFTFTFTQPQGVQDLSWVEMLFAPSMDSIGGCFVHFDRASQALYLALESGSAARGPHRTGVSETVENRQCAIDLAASTATLSGTNLTLNLALRFKPVFLNAVNIYLQSQTNGGLLTAWQSKGTWN